MDASRFSILLSALPIIFMTAYYLFFKREKSPKYLIIFLYSLLVLSSTLFVWMTVSLLAAFFDGTKIMVSKPHPVLLVMSILILIASIYDLFFNKNRKHISKLLVYVLLVFSCVVITWGTISILLTRAL